MAIENPFDLGHNTLKLAGQEDGCNLAAANGTEKKLTGAVKTGEVFIPVMVILDEFDGACGEAVVTFGKYDGDCDEFVGDRTLTNISAAYATECLIIQPVPAATPVASCILTAGQFFAMEITTKEVAALTCRASVLGLFKRA